MTDEADSDVCEECGEPYPDEWPSVEGPFHKTSCSLYEEPRTLEEQEGA